jgi:hypothetical protein
MVPIKVGMSKIFANRIDDWNSPPITEIIDWCEKNLNNDDIHYDNWWYNNRTFYFTDEREYLLFLLRWT